MRLSDGMISLIRRATLESFGDVAVYLFGSRMDDSKIGGDIDLAIDVDLPRSEFRDKKAAFTAYLIRVGCDIKMDIVQYNNKDELLASEIKANSLRLDG